MSKSEWIFTILNTIIAFAGVILTWKAYRKTQVIKETLEESLRREQYFMDFPGLQNDLDDCMEKVLKACTLLSLDVKFTTSLRRVIISLEQHFEKIDNLKEKVKRYKQQFDDLSQTPSPQIRIEVHLAKQKVDYGNLITDLQVLLKTGRN